MPDFFSDIVSAGNRGSGDSILNRLDKRKKKSRKRLKKRVRQERGARATSATAKGVLSQIFSGRKASEKSIGASPFKGSL